MTSRIPDDVWDDLDRGPTPDDCECVRCGGPLDTGPQMVEILRLVGMKYGGLAFQGVAVHQVCWEKGRGEANLLLARESRESRAGWEETVATLRAKVEEREREEDMGWWWDDVGGMDVD